MEIVLERILSLIPRNEAGKFVHGAKKEFAQSIGYSSGDIVSMWESGLSVSYRNKLHEISAKYDVSVEWLRGETDEKKLPPPGMSPERQQLLDLIDSMSDDEVHGLIQIVRAVKQGKF